MKQMLRVRARDRVAADGSVLGAGPGPGIFSCRSRITPQRPGMARRGQAWTSIPRGVLDSGSATISATTSR